MKNIIYDVVVGLIILTVTISFSRIMKSNQWYISESARSQNGLEKFKLTSVDNVDNDETVYYGYDVLGIVGQLTNDDCELYKGYSLVLKKDGGEFVQDWKASKSYDVDRVQIVGKDFSANKYEKSNSNTLDKENISNNGKYKISKSTRIEKVWYKSDESDGDEILKPEADERVKTIVYTFEEIKEWNIF